MLGVAISDPKFPRWANPVSSRTIATTLGDPGAGLGSDGKTRGKPSEVRPTAADAVAWWDDMSRRLAIQSGSSAAAGKADGPIARKVGCTSKTTEDTPK